MTIPNAAGLAQGCRNRELSHVAFWAGSPLYRGLSEVIIRSIQSSEGASARTCKLMREVGVLCIVPASTSGRTCTYELTLNPQARPETHQERQDAAGKHLPRHPVRHHSRRRGADLSRIARAAGPQPGDRPAGKVPVEAARLCLLHTLYQAADGGDRPNFRGACGRAHLRDLCRSPAFRNRS